MVRLAEQALDLNRSTGVISSTVNGIAQHYTQRGLHIMADWGFVSRSGVDTGTWRVEGL